LSSKVIFRRSQSLVFRTRSSSRFACPCLGLSALTHFSFVISIRSSRSGCLFVADRSHSRQDVNYECFD
jgi:hypothetical protein